MHYAHGELGDPTFRSRCLS